MRTWPLAALVACVPYEAHPITPAASSDEMTCHLGAAYEGKLVYPGLTDIATLECTASHHESVAREVCMQPVLGVVETGAVYLSHAPACSSEIAPGESLRFAVQLDVRRSICNRDRGGCIVRVVPLAGDKPDAEDIVAFARALEAKAVAPGRDRPSLRECDELLDGWMANRQFVQYTPFLAHHDDMRLFCLGLSRVELACLRAARTSAEADRCAP